MKRIPIAELSKNVLNLPRLTIPSVANTADRYRASVLALKSGDSVSAHFQKLDNFLSQSAPVLQKTILDNDAAAAAAGGFPHSYVEAQMQTQLLTSRVPLEVKLNKAFVLKRGSVPGTDGTQAGVAATMVHGIGQFIQDVRKNGLAVPTTGAPFDVSPLLTEFGRSLIPSKEADEVYVTPFDKLDHVVVLHDGHLYCIRLFDEATGALQDRALIQKAFEVLLTVTPDMDNAAPVSVLTAANRSVWGQAYQELIKDPENAKELHIIHESILVVCLDSKPWVDDESRAKAAALHGGEEEMENRWYDKHQMIVSADGQVAFNFEPTFSHRSQWARWIDGVLSALAGPAGTSASSPSSTSSSSSSSSSVTTTAGVDAAATAAILRHMHITYGKSFAAHIRSARTEATALVTDTEAHSLVLPYGTAQLAGLPISPDAFVQLTLQVARFTLHEKLCATSEICSTTGFFHGSSEILRSATEEARALAEKVAAIRKASKVATASDASSDAAGGEPNAPAAAAAPAGSTPSTNSDTSKTESATVATSATAPVAKPASATASGASTAAATTNTTAALAKLIVAAGKKHDRLIVEANKGEGVDRHMAALHRVAALNGDKAALAFFEDNLFKSSESYRLNTCEFSRPWLCYYTFGPAREDGYGLGYVIDEQEIRMSVAAHTNSPATDVADMKASIAAAAETIYRSLGGNQL